MVVTESLLDGIRRVNDMEEHERQNARHVCGGLAVNVVNKLTSIGLGRHQISTMSLYEIADAIKGRTVPVTVGS